LTRVVVHPSSLVDRPTSTAGQFLQSHRSSSLFGQLPYSDSIAIANSRNSLLVTVLDVDHLFLSTVRAGYRRAVAVAPPGLRFDHSHSGEACSTTPSSPTGAWSSHQGAQAVTMALSSVGISAWVLNSGLFHHWEVDQLQRLRREVADLISAKDALDPGNQLYKPW
jgi:hypothetical protein